MSVLQRECLRAAGWALALVIVQPSDALALFIVPPSQTTLASSVNPSVVGQPVTLTATVNVAGGTAVSFWDGAVQIGTATLVGSHPGTATITVSNLAYGSHSLTAYFPGDGARGPSTSAPLTQLVGAAGSSTTLHAPSPDPSVFGQAVTLTATVTAAPPGAGQPTGHVSFYDGSTHLGGADTNGAGVATFTTTDPLPAGQRELTAVFNGAQQFNFSTSSIVTHAVLKASTTITVATTPNPSVFGQAVAIQATVAAVAPGAGTPAGVVLFRDGGVTLGTANLSFGQATLTAVPLGNGSRTITAQYGGSASFLQSLSGDHTHTVQKAASSTALGSSDDASVFGQIVTLTASVAAASPGAGLPTGTVTFKDGASTLGTGTLNGSGQASLSTAALSVGSHSLTATYGGDANFNQGSSTGFSQSVAKASTANVVVSSPNPSVTGQAATLTATVTAMAPGAGIPTGTVSFQLGLIQGTVPLDASGQASFSVTPSHIGSQQVVAIYSGDANYHNAGDAVPHVVSPAATATLLVTSPNPSRPGQSVSVNATASALAPGAGVPSGSVTFRDGSAVLGTASLNPNNSNIASLFLPLSRGVHSLTAEYQGDAKFAGSTSAVLRQSVRFPEGDLNGDGRADILWRNVGGPDFGALYVWLMVGKDIAQSSYLDPIGQDWVIQQLGDFNGDGKADILWRNMGTTGPDSGKLYIWMMDGQTVVGGTGYPNSQADLNWAVQGVGDLNGDGRSDIVWRNVGPGADSGALFLWMMNGTAISGASYLPPISTDWVIQRLTDLNGDGKADILWRNMGQGPDRAKLYAWIMDGASAGAGTGYPDSQADLTWAVQGVGDLNGDGNSDLIWRNVGSGADAGALFLWMMNGRSIIGATYLQPISSDWQIEGIADLSADGKSDILWRNEGAGPDKAKLYLWVMDGATVAGGTGYPNSQADGKWQVQNPR